MILPGGQVCGESEGLVVGQRHHGNTFLSQGHLTDLHLTCTSKKRTAIYYVIHMEIPTPLCHTHRHPFSYVIHIAIQCYVVHGHPASVMLHNHIKGTPLRSGCVTHLNFFFQKPVPFTSVAIKFHCYH